MVEYNYHDEPFRYANCDASGEVVFESWDGRRIHRYLADSIHLYKIPASGKQSYEVLFYDNVETEFFVTDSRVLLRIEKSQESHHVDDTMAAVFSNARSSIPAYRRNEMVLMGMIRYEWVSQISFRPKAGFLTYETVRVYYKDEQKSLWFLDVVFKRAADARYIANDILHRMCVYRLAMTDDKDDRELYFFNRYGFDLSIEKSKDPKKMSTVRIPTQYPAPTGEFARPVRGRFPR